MVERIFRRAAEAWSAVDHAGRHYQASAHHVERSTSETAK
jgi:hypothetical protein